MEQIMKWEEILKKQNKTITLVCVEFFDQGTEILQLQIIKELVIN